MKSSLSLSLPCPPPGLTAWQWRHSSSASRHPKGKYGRIPIAGKRPPPRQLMEHSSSSKKNGDGGGGQYLQAAKLQHVTWAINLLVLVSSRPEQPHLIWETGTALNGLRYGSALVSRLCRDRPPSKEFQLLLTQDHPTRPTGPRP